MLKKFDQFYVQGIDIFSKYHIMEERNKGMNLMRFVVFLMGVLVSSTSFAGSWSDHVHAVEACKVSLKDLGSYVTGLTGLLVEKSTDRNPEGFLSPDVVMKASSIMTRKMNDVEHQFEKFYSDNNLVDDDCLEYVMDSADTFEQFASEVWDKNIVPKWPN